MSNAAQCPSTIGKQTKTPARRARPTTQATGQTLWRSLDDLADTEQFQEWMHREFPAGASELSAESRRDFLKLMGASVALAGVVTIPGCRRPDHAIIPYNRAPEDIIPGKSLYYASALALAGGGCEGVLVETHEGRPTKIEGNPLHQFNRGKTSARAQAVALSIYDPERLKKCSRLDHGERVDSSWEEFSAVAKRHFAALDRAGGKGLVFFVDKTSGLSRQAMRARAQQRWPQAQWIAYDPLDDENGLAGSRLAFRGATYRPRHIVERASVILSFDRDFLGVESRLPEIRGFAKGRRVLATSGPQSAMNRLYVAESDMTLTGAAADHRLRLQPSRMPAVVVAVAQAVLSQLGAGVNASLVAALETARGKVGGLEGVDPKWIDAAADDLVHAGGASLVMAGASQPAEVHAITHALNAALGAVGKTVVYDPLEGDLGASSSNGIRSLVAAIRSGQVSTLVVLGCNPVYDAPVEFDFANAYKRVPMTVQLSLEDDETGALSAWQLNAAHPLESWSDVLADDGAPSVVQPMIAPLFGGKTDIELLALLLREDVQDGHAIVQRTWRDAYTSAGGDFEKLWRRALHDGLLAGKARSGDRPAPQFSAIATALSAWTPRQSQQGALDAVFRPCAKLRDGAGANNGWLQELPDPITKITWDNPALVSPATFKTLGLHDKRKRIGRQHAPMARVEVDGKSLEMPVWPSPGVADNTVILVAGYGRQRVGRIGEGAGFDTYALRTSGYWRGGPNARITPTSGSREIATVQDHSSLTPPEAPDSPRAVEIMREFHVDAYRRYGDEVIEEKDHYGQIKRMNFAERVGTASHAPAGQDIYTQWQQDARKDRLNGRHQWGMAIDLSTCIGCGACTIACQAENNIPIVGKEEVVKGREMHWIRVDRYFSGGDGQGGGDVQTHVQPVACVHCEEAPCETVCPVNATNHGREGTNDMVYNRCIGTRYCSNNCPYKVRRFNFFDYATKRYRGDIRLLTHDGRPDEREAVKVPETMTPNNRDLVPPRLRERIQDAEKGLATMQFNPHVTVRSRGVMEKCSYCIQRVNEAKTEVKAKHWERIPDGYFQSACQQACPAGAIAFGDIANPESEVTKMRDHARSYRLLGYLNTRPRTLHMARLRNRNPKLMSQEELALMENPFAHGEGAGDHDTGAEHTKADRPDALLSLPVLGNVAQRSALAMVTGGLA